MLADEIGKTSEFIGPILAGLISSVAGSLVSSGLNAAGNALEQASKEQAIGVEATGSASLAKLEIANDHKKLAQVKPKSTCLILATADGNEEFISILSDDNKSALAGSKFVANANYRNAKVSELARSGISKLPNFYSEVRVFQFEEGIVLRPVTVMYRKAFKGAPPKGAAAAELHVTFATPALATEALAIGSPFAVARLQLPKITPGHLMTQDALYASRSVVLPLRPRAGFVDEKLKEVNGIYATLATRKLEWKTADRALAKAKLSLAAKPKDTALIEARNGAEELFNDAVKAEATAQAAVNQLIPDNSQAIAGIGSTNVKMRFVVIREPNKFGLALAKALNGAAESTGKAVTEGLTAQLKSKPDFTASDTAYLTALTTLQAKELAYASSVEKGGGAAIAAAATEVLLAKAKLNEAAVAINRPIPYPQLF